MLKIKEFTVERLHDVFTYNLQIPVRGEDDFAIFYGDNGSGKTTLEKLLFHILSAAPNKGHLHRIAAVPFRSIKVVLSDETVVSAVRDGPVTSYPVIFSIKRPSEKAIIYFFAPERTRARLIAERVEVAVAENKASAKFNAKFPERISARKDSMVYRHAYESLASSFSEARHKSYIDGLADLGIRPYFLGTDRRVLSDSIEPWAYSSIHKSKEDEEEEISKLRAQYLKDAMERSANYLRRQIIRAANTGSKNTNDIYAEIFKRISKQNTDIDSKDGEGFRSLLAELYLLQRRHRPFVALGLMPAINIQSVLPKSRKIIGASQIILKELLVPYVATLRARLDAMEPIRRSIETFIRGLNLFFSYKYIEYIPPGGFRITGPNDVELNVEQLSSGEQQLLLIFCLILSASDSSSLFIIDEPEISLNVKWQRNLIDSINDIRGASNNQMIIATHSIELLTQHSERVVELDPIVARNSTPVYETEQED
ncbi:AAA family ATPase [Burkholderia pyrrocinia]|uniref:AAA family ATPase n=1 Tax=Burkholderia pyrrocinia TaxID=60550 RepID=UPI001BD0345D|nr:AAA family ATPase [Burkholderia pyrrocinia]QVN22490.1 ATP-binding protein [Burkholderia pyrrocinia]